jgi:hypothetical protein
MYIKIIILFVLLSYQGFGQSYEFNYTFFNSIFNGIEDFKARRELFKPYFNSDSIGFEFIDGQKEVINKTSLSKDSFARLVNYCQVDDFGSFFDDSLFYFKNKIIIIDTLKFFNCRIKYKYKNKRVYISPTIISYNKLNLKNSYLILTDISIGRFGLSILLQDIRSLSYIAFVFNKSVKQKPQLMRIRKDFNLEVLRDYYPQIKFNIPDY